LANWSSSWALFSCGQALRIAKSQWFQAAGSKAKGKSVKRWPPATARLRRRAARTRLEAFDLLSTNHPSRPARKGSRAVSISPSPPQPAGPATLHFQLLPALQDKPAEIRRRSVGFTCQRATAAPQSVAKRSCSGSVRLVDAAGLQQVVGTKASAIDGAAAPRSCDQPPLQAGELAGRSSPASQTITSPSARCPPQPSPSSPTLGSSLHQSSATAQRKLCRPRINCRGCRPTSTSRPPRLDSQPSSWPDPRGLARTRRHRADSRATAPASVTGEQARTWRGAAPGPPIAAGDLALRGPRPRQALHQSCGHTNPQATR